MVKCNFRLPHTGIYDESMQKGNIITKEDIDNQEVEWYECDLVSNYTHRCDEEDCVLQKN